MKTRWQDGKRFTVHVEDYNGHRFEAVARVVDAFKIGNAIRAQLELETPCPHGNCFIGRVRVMSRPSQRAHPIRAFRNE